MITKRCTKCSAIKSEDEFYYNSGTDDRLTSWCKECQRTYNKEKRHIVTLQGFGLTEIDYEIMFSEQNKVCAICGQPEIKKMFGKICRLAIDHDHLSGINRELLCSNCNNMLGQAKDDPEILRKAIDYLEKHRKRIQRILNK